MTSQQPIIILAGFIILLLTANLSYTMNKESPDYTCAPNISVNITNPTIKIINPVIAQHTKNIASPSITTKGNITRILMETKAIDDWGFLGGNSMQPTIFEGNTVISNKITPETKLKPGMIVRYRSVDKGSCKATPNPQLVRSEYIIHRIVAIYDEETIIMGGDNNAATEEIKKCQITHVIVGTIYT